DPGVTANPVALLANAARSSAGMSTENDSAPALTESTIASNSIISHTAAPAAALVCAPYQKVATTARTSAGTLAPKVPKDTRASTGYGTPVFTPALPT